MKKLGIFILALFVVAGSGTLYGQEKKSKKQRKAEQTEMKVKQLIDTQKYIFIGTDPLAPTVESRTQKNYLIVTKDKIETSFLPQYSKENYLVSGLISFYEDFDYKAEKSEKGGWEISINVELGKFGDAVEMLLKVSPDGSAELDVYSRTKTGNRDYFVKNFIGYIEGPKRNGNF